MTLLQLRRFIASMKLSFRLVIGCETVVWFPAGPWLRFGPAAVCPMDTEGKAAGV
jgi:hypothetical protein